jgi:UDP-glucose 4-epimerase
MKKILLTGGSGFIGRNIRESYLGEKYNIVSPTRNELDLIDDLSVKEFFSKNVFDVVIHSACKPGHRNAADPNGVFYANTRMYFNLMKHSDNFRKMIYLSSGAIYDVRNNISKATEDSYTHSIPSDEHGFSKYVIAKHLELADKVVELRIFGIFGKYEDYSIRFISNAICKTLFNLPITIKQNRKFDYLYVNDLMPILETFIEKKFKYNSYNITPTRSVELYEIAKLVRQRSGKPSAIIVDKPGLGFEYSGNNGRLLEEISDTRFETLDRSIQSLFDWYFANIDSLVRDKLLVDK